MPFNKITYISQKLLADTITPVSLLLKLRDRYSPCLLLESSDYHGHENSISFICCESLFSFSYLPSGVLECSNRSETNYKEKIDKADLFPQLRKWNESFSFTGTGSSIPNGSFGYMTFDAAESAEDISFTGPHLHPDLPVMCYSVFRYVIMIDHFSNSMTLQVNFSEGEYADPELLESLKMLVLSRPHPSFKFISEGPESSITSDNDFAEILGQGINECKKGNVFQVVLSRRFTREFKGDDFNVYRALRSINPSAWLFYFDYGHYRIFGSSPEAQLVVKKGRAAIHPIAGTFRRTGDDEHDARLARELAEDPKENAEHVMLVDLARNDLSRNCRQVKVEKFAEIQFYSHVIHLVSKVTGVLEPGSDALKVAAETFPAGTLSGAPKYMAMQIINRLEHHRRGFYGGCIGFLGPDGTFNHAILIRSFLSRDNKLHYQAGAGIVAASVIESEMQEVHNKLAALRKAIDLAVTL
ncbi:MAG: anthranilate synthase component I family protein [Bacteroidota bacterium]